MKAIEGKGGGGANSEKVFCNHCLVRQIVCNKFVTQPVLMLAIIWHILIISNIQKIESHSYYSSIL